MDNESSTASEVYCLCRSSIMEEDEDVKWIACDNPKGCPIEWFHIECVGLTDDTVPEDDWYCEKCKLELAKSNDSENSTSNKMEENDKDCESNKKSHNSKESTSQPLRLYICEICDEQYHSKDDLLKHKQQQHTSLYKSQNMVKDNNTQGSDSFLPTANISQSTIVSQWDLKSTTSEERATDPMSPQEDLDNQSSGSTDIGSKQHHIELDEDGEEMVNLDEEKIRILSQFSDEQIIAEMAARKEAFVCCCGIVFEDQSLYFLHKGCHNTNNPKKCSFCGFEANDWYDFTSHFFVHKNQKRF